jgi:hypothetical protein
MIGKLGLVLECGKGGPDELVMTCLVRRLSPETQVVTRSRGNKRAIFNEGLETAQALVEVDRCDLVLVQWDTKPYWEGPPAARSCEDEAGELREKLAALPDCSEATKQKIRLLCLSVELETWLLADPAAIREHLSTATHPCKWKGATPASVTDAKATLDMLCIAHRGRGRRYSDFSEAAKIARRWNTTRKLRKVSSFARFANLLTGKADAEFVADGSVCNDLCHAGAMMGR